MGKLTQPKKHRPPGTVEKLKNGHRTWGEIKLKSSREGDNFRVDSYQDYVDTIKEWFVRIPIDKNTKKA